RAGRADRDPAVRPGAVQGRSRAGRDLRPVRAGGPDVARDAGGAGDSAGDGGVAPSARARAVPNRGQSHRARDAPGGERVTSDPKRLTVVGATDLERTLLQAARHE